ncbi:hypothetical protein R3P38DRAFT_2867232 [Favolaschia claudopus]|uniref:Nicotinamide-nucleotide adenylyltransferase n=1 Tax=Favolaschia claudopus TaxID=2862362 RepID=A0AAW0D9S1_9AGAR
MNSISRASASALLHSVQRGLSPFELVYTPHERWPLPRPSPSISESLDCQQRPLHISVLDSSFNPPTTAHLALAHAPRPTTSTDTNTDCDAQIYLLSVRNADKTLKSTDATYIQRLEMMLLLAQDRVAPNESLSDEHQVAIGIIDEPTFVGKASKLRAWVEMRLGELGVSRCRPEFTFLLGLDTLERVLAPRYYGSSATDPDARSKMFTSLHTFFSPDHDNSRIVCARRSSASSPEADTLKIAEPFLSEGRITMIDIGQAEQTYSSTAVRDALGRPNDDDWKSLVSPRVAEYISAAKLYTSSAEVQ